MFPLYLITDPVLYASNSAEFAQDSRRDRGRALFHTIDLAMEGGARLIQYRDKKSSRAEMYETARQLRALTEARGATLIINDQIDLAAAVKADGVHLGQEDLPLWVARKVLGNEAIVGISTHHMEEAIQAEAEGADYIGFGPIFETGTKSDARAPIGIEAIAEVKRKVHLPVYAIGGIGLSRLPDIIAAGADGAAVASALAGDIRTNVMEWLEVFRRFGKLSS